jgi:beta-glucosidase
MYETFSEDPYLVSAMGAAVIEGIQNFTGPNGMRTAACAKHFIGGLGGVGTPHVHSGLGS